MLELYKTFHQPIWTIALFIALYFPNQENFISALHEKIF